MTAISPTSLCINPEDEGEEPVCLDVLDPALLTDAAQGACVEAVGTLDRKLVRVKALDRVCKVPRRDS